MDVLEHVDDDVTLLRDYAARAAPGTRFVVTVPAFNWLWSSHDVFLGHKRRYTLRQIRSVVEAAGLSVERGCYFYAAVLPLAAASRLLGRLTGLLGAGAPPRSQMRSVGAPLNRLLWSACRAELPVFHRNKLFGLTAVVAARKAP